jgi:hypothetical protein
MKPNLVLFTSRQNDPTDCILVRKYQKIQSTDQSTILTNYNIYLLNLKLKGTGTDFGDSSGVPRSVPRKTPAFFQNLDAEPPSQCVPTSAYGIDSALR